MPRPLVMRGFTYGAPSCLIFLPSWIDTAPCTQWDYVADRFGAADLLPFTISDMDFATAPALPMRCTSE